MAGLAVEFDDEIISGVMYFSVPASFFSAMFPLHRPDMPKSTTLILVLALDSNKTFSSLRSLWMIPF